MKRLLLATLFVAQTALAQHFDAIVTGRTADGTAIADLIVGGQTISVADIAVVAAAPEGRVFAVTESNPARIVELLHPATARRTIGELPQDWAANAMVVDRNANVHILATGKPYGVALFTVGANGVVRAEYQMSSLYFGSAFPGAIDLAADQCTLFMSDVFGGIRRFDVCEGKFLADFQVSEFLDRRPVRILPDGGVLYGLIRYDANGQVVGNLRIRSSLVGMAFALTRGGTRIVIAGERCDPDEESNCPSDPLIGQLEIVEVDVDHPKQIQVPGNEITIGKLTTAQPETIVPLFAWTAALGNTRPSRRRAAGF
ncbi:MAG TPA: hypothetical protein VF787_17790 [Thermoanaerobaculia bacterium]